MVRGTRSVHTYAKSEDNDDEKANLVIILSVHLEQSADWERVRAKNCIITVHCKRMVQWRIFYLPRPSAIRLGSRDRSANYLWYLTNLIFTFPSLAYYECIIAGVLLLPCWFSLTSYLWCVAPPLRSFEGLPQVCVAYVNVNIPSVINAELCASRWFPEN